MMSTLSEKYSTMIDNYTCVWVLEDVTFFKVLPEMSCIAAIVADPIEKSASARPPMSPRKSRGP